MKWGAGFRWYWTAIVYTLYIFMLFKMYKLDFNDDYT